MVAAWEDRVRHVAGHVLTRTDGVVVCLSDLPDPELNVALVERQPEDALAALAVADWTFRAHGRRLGVEIERARHPGVDRAVRALGLEPAIELPAMAIDIAEIATLELPPGVSVSRVTTPEELEHLGDLETRIFGTEPAVARVIYGPSALALDRVAFYLARLDGVPAALAWTDLHEGALGVFGVGTVPEARRRGLGRSVTTFAVLDAEGADLAWLHPTPDGVPLYGSMGFYPVANWEIWVHPVDRGLALR